MRTEKPHSENGRKGGDEMAKRLVLAFGLAALTGSADRAAPSSSSAGVDARAAMRGAEGSGPLFLWPRSRGGRARDSRTCELGRDRRGARCARLWRGARRAAAGDAPLRR